MIFAVDTKEFRAALSYIGGVVPKKPIFPILQNVKIGTNDNRITLTGTDMDITLETEVSAAVDTEGAFCIPFATLSKFVGFARTETCKIEVEESQAKVSAGRNRVTLSAVDVLDYPNIPPAEGELAAFDPTGFCAALKFCMAAASDSEVQFHIAGVNFSQSGDSVHVWGTDGQSAHFANLNAPNTISDGGTLPAASCGVALSIGDKANDLQFMINKTGWHMATDKARAWGKVVDAPYPNMQGVVDQFATWGEVASVRKDEMADALSIATCGTEADSTKSRNVIVRCEGGNPITIRGDRAIGGVVHAGRAEMEVLSKGDFLGGLSAKYLMAAIAGIGGDDVLVESAFSDKTDRNALRLSDAQSSATLSMSATVLAMRMSDAELADVL